MDDTERLRWIVRDYARRTDAACIILQLMHEQANRNPKITVEVSRSVIDNLIRTLGGVVPSD